MFNKDNERKRMLNNEISHEEFYMSLANVIGIPKLEALLPEKHLTSDLTGYPGALQYWDVRANSVAQLFAAAKRNGEASGQGLTLAETVSLQKTLSDYLRVKAGYEPRNGNIHKLVLK